MRAPYLPLAISQFSLLVPVLLVPQQYAPFPCKLLLSSVLLMETLWSLGRKKGQRGPLKGGPY